MLRDPKRAAHGTAPPFKRRFTEHKPPGPGRVVVPGFPSGQFVREAAFHRRSDFTWFVLDRSMQNRVSVDRDDENVEGRRSSVFSNVADLYDCRAVGLERREVLAESGRRQVPERVNLKPPPATAILELDCVVGPVDGGDRVEDLSGSRQPAEREPGVGSPGQPGPPAGCPDAATDESTVRKDATRGQERPFLGHGQVEPDDLLGYELVRAKELEPVGVGYPESVAEPAHICGRKLEITRPLARATDAAKQPAIGREDRN